MQNNHLLNLNFYVKCLSVYTFQTCIVYFVFVVGLGPMPWTINSEIYPLWARGTCIAMTTAVNWIFNLVVSFSFLTMTETITTYGKLSQIKPKFAIVNLK